MASRLYWRLAFFDNAIHQLLKRVGIRGAVALPMPTHVSKRHEISKGTFKAFAEFVIRDGVFQILMDQGKLVEPELQIAPLPYRIGIVSVFENWEKLWMGEAKAQQFAVDVGEVDQRFGLALARGATHLDGHEQQPDKCDCGGKHRDKMV